MKNNKNQYLAPIQSGARISQPSLKILFALTSVAAHGYYTIPLSKDC